VDYLQELADVLGETRYAIAFLALLAVLGILFGTIAGIVLISPIGVNQLADPLRIATTAATALLASANLAVAMRNHEIQRPASGAGSMTLLGVFMSTFVGSCPLCQPAWLFWLGLGSVSGILGAIGMIFGLASMAFLIMALKISLESGKCGIKR
jgi:hypothetical protein